MHRATWDVSKPGCLNLKNNWARETRVFAIKHVSIRVSTIEGISKSGHTPTSRPGTAPYTVRAWTHDET